jgi:hypothetical protein
LFIAWCYTASSCLLWSQEFYSCETMYQCFFHTTNVGLRSGGGIGDAIQAPAITQNEGLYFGTVRHPRTLFLSHACVTVLSLTL